MCIEMLVERVLEGAGWIAGNNGKSLLVGDRLSQGIAVIGGVGDDNLGGQSFNQLGGLWRIALLPCGQREPDRATKSPHGQVDFGAQAAP